MSKTFRDLLEELTQEPKLSASKLYALSKMNKKSLETFNEIWPSTSVDRKRDIVKELMETAEMNFEVDFVPVFLISLGDEDAEVRATAIKGLWDYEDPALIQPLVHLLKNDEAMNVRAAAALALGKFVYLKELEEIDWNEATLAEEALIETIYHAEENLDVQRRAVEAIAFSSRPGVPQIIESAYYSDHEKMQVSAVFAMGRSADPRWIPRVLSELENASSEIRFEAVKACGELEAKDAVDQLIIMIDEEPDPEVRQTALWALGKIGGDTARLALEACLDSEEESLALAAEEALDELNIFSEGMMLYDFEYGDDPGDDLDDFFDVPNSNGHQKTE